MDTQNTTERVEEKRTNKHGLGLAPSTRREKFVQLSVHLQAIASMYSSETPTKSPGILTHLLTLSNPASQFTGSSSRLSRLSASPVLSPLDSRTFLPSSSSGLVGNLTHKPFVWVSRQNRQRNLLNAQHRVTPYLAAMRRCTR